MSGLEIAAGVGVATSVYGQIASAQKQADAARKNAEIKAAQADELLQREAINEQIMRDKGELASKYYSAAFASTGREGAGIGGMLQIYKDTQENIRLSRRDAEFKAAMLRAGAEVDTNLASDYASAGYIGAGSSVLTGATKIYDFERSYGNKK